MNFEGGGVAHDVKYFVWWRILVGLLGKTKIVATTMFKLTWEITNTSLCNYQ